MRGPNYLSPPYKIDSFGWLDPVLTILDVPYGVNEHAYSWSVYTDDTINRDKNFLTPVIRFAHWDRPHEQAVRRVRKWPIIAVFQHVLSDSEQRQTDILLRAMDHSLSNIEFYEAGLIANRETPPECHTASDGSTLTWNRHLTIIRSNACQRIEFSLGPFGVDNHDLEAAAHALSEYIGRLCLSYPSQVPYRENYDENLRTFARSGRGWFFRSYRSKHASV